MERGMHGRLTIVNDPLVYRLSIVVANSNLLRLNNEWAQGKVYRNEKAIEFQ